MILFRNVGIAGNGEKTTLLRKENDQGNAAYWYCRAGSLCAGNHSMWNLRASRETILVCFWFVDLTRKLRQPCSKLV
jgi:hypothetical protein